ncbi:hypothetical protein BDR26DRAFT_875470 [Obelidium mucronatum]|nr:hypothetical protein BDR26DRAFT_875470 [Obelidium mucronatum]
MDKVARIFDETEIGAACQLSFLTVYREEYKFACESSSSYKHWIEALDDCWDECHPYEGLSKHYDMKGKRASYVGTGSSTYSSLPQSPVSSVSRSRSTGSSSNPSKRSGHKPAITSSQSMTQEKVDRTTSRNEFALLKTRSYSSPIVSLHANSEFEHLGQSYASVPSVTKQIRPTISAATESSISSHSSSFSYFFDTSKRVPSNLSHSDYQIADKNIPSLTQSNSVSSSEQTPILQPVNDIVHQSSLQKKRSALSLNFLSATENSVQHSAINHSNHSLASAKSPTKVTEYVSNPINESVQTLTNKSVKASNSSNIQIIPVVAFSQQGRPQDSLTASSSSQLQSTINPSSTAVEDSAPILVNPMPSQATSSNCITKTTTTSSTPSNTDSGKSVPIATRSPSMKKDYTATFAPPPARSRGVRRSSSFATQLRETTEDILNTTITSTATSHIDRKVERRVTIAVLPKVESPEPSEHPTPNLLENPSPALVENEKSCGMSHRLLVGTGDLDLSETTTIQHIDKKASAIPMPVAADEPLQFLALKRVLVHSEEEVKSDCSNVVGVAADCMLPVSVSVAQSNVLKQPVKEKEASISLVQSSGDTVKTAFSHCPSLLDPMGGGNVLVNPKEEAESVTASKILQPLFAAEVLLEGQNFDASPCLQPPPPPGPPPLHLLKPLIKNQVGEADSEEEEQEDDLKDTDGEHPSSFDCRTSVPTTPWQSPVCFPLDVASLEAELMETYGEMPKCKSPERLAQAIASVDTLEREKETEATAEAFFGSNQFKDWTCNSKTAAEDLGEPVGLISHLALHEKPGESIMETSLVICNASEPTAKSNDVNASLVYNNSGRDLSTTTTTSIHLPHVEVFDASPVEFIPPLAPFEEMRYSGSSTPDISLVRVIKSTETLVERFLATFGVGIGDSLITEPNEPAHHMIPTTSAAATVADRIVPRSDRGNLAPPPVVAQHYLNPHITGTSSGRTVHKKRSSSLRTPLQF